MLRVLGVQTFQPTLPARGATRIFGATFGAINISTHAPRTGSDDNGLLTEDDIAISTHAPRTGSDCAEYIHRRTFEHFNPRSPHGERLPISPLSAQWLEHFNPRSPHGERRATW